MRLIFLCALSLTLSCKPITAPASDAGSDDAGGFLGAEPSSLCASVCALYETCFGEGFNCVEECTTDLSSCSEQERIDLGGCADAASCPAFDMCTREVPCMSKGGGSCDFNNQCNGNENCESCPNDCGPCGNCNFNNVCDGVEDCSQCPDCGPCSTCDDNGLCNGNENCSNCPNDCGNCGDLCGNSLCDTAECELCAGECGNKCNSCRDECVIGAAQTMACGFCAAQVCSADTFCCEEEWDGPCVGLAEQLCGLECPAVCGDNSCDGGETAASCGPDCGG